MNDARLIMFRDLYPQAYRSRLPKIASKLGFWFQAIDNHDISLLGDMIGTGDIPEPRSILLEAIRSKDINLVTMLLTVPKFQELLDDRLLVLLLATYYPFYFNLFHQSRTWDPVEDMLSLTEVTPEAYLFLEQLLEQDLISDKEVEQIQQRVRGLGAQKVLQVLK